MVEALIKLYKNINIDVILKKYEFVALCVIHHVFKSRVDIAWLIYENVSLKLSCKSQLMFSFTRLTMLAKTRASKSSNDASNITYVIVVLSKQYIYIYIFYLRYIF